MKKVPVAGLLLASVATAWDNRVIYAQALAIPAMLLAGLTYAATSVSEADAEVPDWFWYVTFLSGIVSILFAIACHRLVLTGPPERPFAVSFGRRELKFLGVSLLLGLIFVGTMLGVMLVLFVPLSMFLDMDPEGLGFWVPGILGVLPAYYVLARYSLVLPAVAVEDNGFFIQDSWRMTRGNEWQVFSIVAVYPFAMSLVGELFLLAGENPITYALSSLAYCAGLALGIFALSFVYRFLREGYAPESV